MAKVTTTRRRRGSARSVEAPVDPLAEIRELRVQMIAMLRVGHGDDAHRTKLEGLRELAEIYRKRYPEQWEQAAQEDAKR